ncbi:serine/arginine repetitive matrix protein 4 isoform X2 [Parasteatoda tepidariorum]|nr:serine/arginine repetitive matrix protein 1 isoform X2 [Parasteatoda tepidariorum]
MMMSSKAPRKLIKNMRGSPIRKEHMMKRPGRSGSPIRSSGNSRPPIKHLSPGMKRGHLISSSSKSIHPSRMRSITSPPRRSVPRHSMPGSPDSMDRSRSYKRSKYEKRKGPSISPVRHPSSLPIPHDRRDPSPYQDSRYLNTRSVPHISPHDRLEPIPPKKKIRREPDRFPRSPSPGILRKSSNEIPFISDGGIALRSEISPLPSAMPMISRGYLPVSGHNERVERNYRTQHSPSPVPNIQSKRQPPPMKSAYETAVADRYKADIPSSGFPSGSDKKYNLTLHERFSTVESEPRIRYSREDLEKITIDIRRNIREPSPTLRQIVNPSDVKLVRRANEGHRPIFDREEIKQAPRDMREDAYFEKKTTSSDNRSYQQSHSMGFRDVENYEITRHRFDGHPPPFQSSSNRPLSERWQGSDGKKDSGPLDQDDRMYEKNQPKKGYVEVRNRSKSRDRDFRSERYTGKIKSKNREVSHGRPEYIENRSHGPPPSEVRAQIIRKEAHHETRRLGMKESRGLSPPPRSESRSHLYPVPDKRYPEGISRMNKHSMRRSRSPGMDSRKYRQRSRSRDDKIPEYSRKPDKYPFKSWPDKRDSSPPGPSYFAPNKDLSPPPYRGRSSSRPFRGSRGFRGRGFRGSPRGGFRGRGSFRGSPNARGRGGPRRGRFSPHLWEHDMYRLSPDRK